MHKKKTKNKTHHHPKRIHRFHNSGSIDDILNRLANELDQMARRQLRNHVLGGNLANLEDEIRQDAVLTCLKWYLQHDHDPEADPKGNPADAWYAPRSLAAALSFQKLEYARKLGKEAKLKKRLTEAGGGCLRHPYHPYHLPITEWPEEVAREFVRRGIESAARTGRISRSNASIALLVYHDHEPVAEVATRLKVSCGAIKQQLSRVRRNLGRILDHVEMPHPW